MAIIGADTRAICAIEEASFASWPAVETVANGSWVLRLSPNLPYKRTNSINCLNPQDDRDCAARLTACEAIFQRHALPPILRATPLTPPDLLAACQARGWTGPSTTTHVMVRALNGAEPAHRLPDDITLTTLTEPDALWRTDYTRLNQSKGIDPDAIATTLSKIAPPVLYLALKQAGQALGVAVGVVDQDLVGLFGLAIAPEARRQGLGYMLSQHILHWGAEQGATRGWLQVEADNPGAIALYERLGYQQLYDYTYWIGPDQGEQGET